MFCRKVCVCLQRLHETAIKLGQENIQTFLQEKKEHTFPIEAGAKLPKLTVLLF